MQRCGEAHEDASDGHWLFFQIAVNALTVASRFDWLFLIARKPGSAAEIFASSEYEAAILEGNLTMRVFGLGGLNNDFCVAISTR